MRTCQAIPLRMMMKRMGMAMTRVRVPVEVLVLCKVTMKRR